ncbi:EAL domain-containing protein [Nakamurella sp. A5-74]|uniref:EAL domain-containing protein n=1 Tax=Nakamurella sp. A5-74 TaxID=3158264 RepID=A0AAU8DSB1_9ACTN
MTNHDDPRTTGEDRHQPADAAAEHPVPSNPDGMDQRLPDLVELIVELASGNLAARLAPSSAQDPIDAVITGINLLAEELQDVYSGLEARVEERTELLRRAQSELERLALRDPLTGLANRSLFAERVGQAIDTSAGPAADQPAVMLLDLDGFKTINDSLGHTAGDAVLVEVARRLNSVVREVDTVARLGGDEFAIVMPGVGSAAAVEIADQALEAMKVPLTVHGRSVWVHASIGVRIAEYGDSADLLLRDADTAMYEAKTNGRARVLVYEQAMHHAVQRRLRVVSELGTAIHNGHLRLTYQPIIALPSRRLIGVEALVRWHHPHRGLIMPEEFIRIAEESGLIVDLGRWVSRTAVSQVAAWLPLIGDREFRMHLNVSPVELRRPGLAEFVANTLSTYQVSSDFIALEISESVLMSEDPVGADALADLQAQGIQLQIDDFGTGYSSISYLRRLPIHTVKVDRSLISTIVEDPVQRRFVGAIFHLVESVGLSVVVEGVETEQQAETLVELGFTRAQGYLFGVPQSAEAITALLETEAATPPSLT